MTLIFFVLFGAAAVFDVTDSSLESCYKCDDVSVKKPEDCITRKDWCRNQERCLLMTYLNTNDEAIYDARCSTELECFSKAAEERLCDLKKNCTVIHCCEDNLCNAADATWIRFDVRLLAFVFVAFFVLMWK
ncbi:uncharacterized protein LOC130628902 [Hydractinia symbiolongicarpus]|uniref:uncharacterized protein LOC130628902 n=1 Tax=Hydractinia symbiolongicarpus TaxID=13093 RepID=UPI00254D7CB5|nr:uncharacterized protein LOC130628902 [Hydractinia symbiolongicarpus]